MGLADKRLSDGEARNAWKYLRIEDRIAFVEKFDQQRNDERQLMHTGKELIVGVFIARLGYAPRYEPQLSGQTPDWLASDQKDKPKFLAEVLNFHMNRAIEVEIDQATTADGFWCGDLPNSNDRLVASLSKKPAKYKALADRTTLPLVVFLYAWFDAFLSPHELRSLLVHDERGLLSDYPQLSGVYHFDDAINGIGQPPAYRFRYYPNPFASRPFNLPDGEIPVPIPTPE